MFFGCRNSFIALILLSMIKNTEVKKASSGHHGDEIDHISSYIQSDRVEAKKKRANLHFILYTSS